MSINGLCAAAGLAAVVGIGATALADVNYGFTNVTNNGGFAFASSHNSMFSLNVAEAGVNGAGRVLANFTFRVDVSQRPSSICDTYFYDGHILGLAGITSSAGVSFSEGASPGHLPGYSTPATRLFAADSNSPVAANGVNANNEWLTLRFELINGATFGNLIQDLNTGAVVVGIHVQQQAYGRSNSYIGTPVLIPLPPSVLAGASGLAGLGLVAWARRRRRN
jgi:hypothetical protein